VGELNLGITLERTVSSENQSHLPKVLVVTYNPDHQTFFDTTLSPYFSISHYRDVDQAMEECVREPAQVIIIDQNGRSDRNSDRFIEHSILLGEKCPGLIATAGPELVFDIRQSEIDAPSQFIRWPLTTKKLLDTVSNIVGRKAEFVWRELPDEIGQPLTLTVEEYQGISDAIANGDPIDCNSAAESCGPLMTAVGNGGHHDLLKAVQSHHNYTYVHSMRVATLLTLFGHGLGMRGDDLLTLSTGGLIHDVGKLVTPEQILDKPGKLTEDEWPVMRDHVTRSSQLLGDATDVTKGALIIAGQHHEKIDGTGYPNGLKGSELNELARMSVIVDIFGALTDARSYKPPFPQEKAFGILESMQSQIDQNLLKVFRAIFEPGSGIGDKAA
jgi:HD-GYP domain-containing protein (c-di-GMP phosphodiesterase class II)